MLSQRSRHAGRLVGTTGIMLLATVACGHQRTATPLAGVAAEGTGRAATCATPPPEEQDLLAGRSITARDSGKTLVLHQTDRFSVYLDDATYPLGTLESQPAGLLGYVSNGSIRGPGCYPIMFEAVEQGTVVLRGGDFHLKILIDNGAQQSTLPLP